MVFRDFYQIFMF